MVQQLGNTRTDKQLKPNDIKMITYASFLNLFHNQTMWKPYLFGIYPRIIWIYTKRVSDSNYKCQIICSWINGNYYSSYLNSGATVYSEITVDSSKVKNWSSDLICENNDEERVLVWTNYNHNLNSSFDKSKLGFFITPLKSSSCSYNSNSASINSHFQYKIVFTPKPGVFPVQSS